MVECSAENPAYTDPRRAFGEAASPLVRHALTIVIAPRIENGLEFIGGLFHFVFPAQLDGFAIGTGDLMAAESVSR